MVAVQYTLPGVPMIYSGQEFGEITPKIVGPNPLNWDRLERPQFQALHARMRELIHLRRENTAFTRGDYATLRAEGSVHAFLRADEDAASP